MHLKIVRPKFFFLENIGAHSASATPDVHTLCNGDELDNDCVSFYYSLFYFYSF